jgi:surface antigen
MSRGTDAAGEGTADGFPVMTLQRLLMLLVVAVCLSQPALAQINPFRGSSGTPLNRDDIAALTDATYRLLDQPQLVAGASETWSNPQSGVSGTVTAGSAVKRHGMTCRLVHYERTVPNRSANRSTSLTRCKTKDGWKIG